MVINDQKDLENVIKMDRLKGQINAVMEKIDDLVYELDYSRYTLELLLKEKDELEEYLTNEKN